ncbi:MAG: hypothetical protein HC908_15955 [Calothrix sp. SM1_7_51]|nr:hypothetical protein [Calothrix sp. SM1_7_51]
MPSLCLLTDVDNLEIRLNLSYSRSLCLLVDIKEKTIDCTHKHQSRGDTFTARYRTTPEQISCLLINK